MTRRHQPDAMQHFGIALVFFCIAIALNGAASVARWASRPQPIAVDREPDPSFPFFAVVFGFFVLVAVCAFCAELLFKDRNP